jgi:drug/metabolite transporter (DMT)-like permease
MSGYTSRPSRLQLWSAFAALYVLWGSNFLAIRYAAEEIPPFLMMGVRCALAGAILFAWGIWHDGARPRREHWVSAAAVGSLLFLGCHGLLAWAEQTVPSGVASLFLATTPVWLSLLDWAVGGPRPTRRTAVGLALGLLGLVFLIGPVPGPIVALLVLVASAFAWAAGSILSRHVPLPGSLVLSSGMQLLAGSVALSLAGLLAGEPARFDPSGLTARGLGGFAYMVIVSSLVGFTTFTWLMRVAPPAQVGTYAFVNPVVALAVGWAIGGEALSGATLGASAVIVAGVALIVTGTRRDGKGQAADRETKGDADDRARVEGDDPGGAGRPVPRVPEAHGPGPLPAHTR